MNKKNNQIKEFRQTRPTRTPPTALVHLLNEFEVAEILGISVATIRRWRLLGQGPQFLKCGAAVRYSVTEVTDWLASRPRGGENSAGAGR